MIALHFNVKDMFRSIRLAFSFQRLWIQFVGLLSSYLIYLVLTYVAFMVAGEGVGEVWDRYGLLPICPGTYMPVISVILCGLAVVILAFGAMLTSTAVARAVYMNLKGNTFYTYKEALAFAWRKKLSIIGTPVLLALFMGLFMLGGGVMGWLGRFPWLSIGPILTSVLTLVWFIACLFLVFMGIALAVSLILTPAILAATDDDAFEGLFQSFSIAFSQPWRLLFYQAVNVLTSGFGLVVFVLLAKVSWKVMNGIFLWGMGAKFADIATQASYYVQSWTSPFVIYYQSLLPESVGRLLFFSYNFTSVALPAGLAASALIMAIFLIVLGGYVLCYPLAILNTGHVLAFLVIKKIKDDENLLERKDREEEDDEEQEEETAESPAAEPEPAAPKPEAKKKAKK
ncbi:hypothetical protein JW948_00135 [bacterium]|nr:hypothetical protein [bacterium]